MIRGDVVTIVANGDFGKPRPAVIVQSDVFSGMASVTVLPMTSMLVDAPLLRVAVAPSPENGLTRPTHVMVDKAITVRRDKVGDIVGHLERETMLVIERCLAVFLGIVT